MLQSCQPQTKSIQSPTFTLRCFGSRRYDLNVNSQTSIHRYSHTVNKTEWISTERALTPLRKAKRIHHEARRCQFHFNDLVLLCYQHYGEWFLQRSIDWYGSTGESISKIKYFLQTVESRRAISCSRPSSDLDTHRPSVCLFCVMDLAALYFFFFMSGIPSICHL